MCYSVVQFTVSNGCSARREEIAMNTAIAGPFDLSAGILVFIAAMRAVWLVTSGGDPPLDIWRRRWVEVLGIVLLGVLLFAISRQFT